MRRNLKLTLSYDGSEYRGWQIQPGLPTIQGILTDVIGRTTGEKVLPQGSGRTDAGVHAKAQVATFSTESPIPLENFLVVLNDRLPPSIRITAVEEVGDEFHARHSAKEKTYEYRIYRGDICPPWLYRFVTHYPYPLDEQAVMEAAGRVVGEHDFTSFAASDPDKATRENDDEELPERATNVRTIWESEWRREGHEMIYRVRGNGFLHHMVRNLVGTFLLVGKGTWTADDVTRILAARDRTTAGPTAPASGLWLMKVEY